jgi:ubiquinone/menaquinone biosynthesis C-methylase UbiE
MPTARSTFESWAPTYELSVLQSLLFEPVHRTVLHQLYEHAPRGTRVLDVGCGTGRLLDAVHGCFPLAVGVDVSTRMLAAATCLRPGPLFVCAVAERLPFASRAFDAVTATLSLRHWQDAECGVRELARVLSPDGVLVVADADIEEVMRPRTRWYFRHPHGRQLAVLLGGCGLDVVDHRLAPVHGPVPSIHVLTARRRHDSAHWASTPLSRLANATCGGLWPPPAAGSAAGPSRLREESFSLVRPETAPP